MFSGSTFVRILRTSYACNYILLVFFTLIMISTVSKHVNPENNFIHLTGYFVAVSSGVMNI